MKNFVEEDDRISELPDVILIKILSLLNTVEAASTSVLSKRWQYAWTHVTALNLYSPKKLRVIEKASKLVTYVRADEYIDMVKRVMQLHQATCITDFKVLFFMTGREFDCNVDEWFSFAIQKSVQRLAINLGGSTLLGGRREKRTVGFTSVVPLPDTFHAPTNKVYSLIKSPYGLSCIQSLTELSLTCVNVTGELVEHFLSNCPLLLGLHVCFSQHLVHLNVAGPSLCLKFLEISGCPHLEYLDIYAPSLASFICLGLEPSTQVLLRHAPLLVYLTAAHPEGFLNALPAIHFSQLESLTLSFDFRWDASAPPVFPEWTNLKNLTFAGYANEEDSFLDWISLIEKAPILRTFTLQLMSSKRIRTEVRIKPTERHLHRCLEVVKFVGSIDFELALYFFQRAVSLETIIVDRRHPSLEPWQEFEENESSMLLKNHARDLEAQLTPIPPKKIKLVICP